MTAHQQTMDLSQRAIRTKAGPYLARKMIGILAMRKIWTTRAQFAYYGLTDRQCRLGRAASHGRILRSAHGYKLIRHCSKEEYERSMAAWTAQIKAEQHQHAITAKRWHGGER